MTTTQRFLAYMIHKRLSLKWGIEPLGFAEWCERAWWYRPRSK